MREFARLYAELDETTSTKRKLDALQAYFSQAAPENAAWAVYFLAGGKPRQAVPVKLLRQYATQYAGLDEWLFDECYNAVGDLAETIAHILPAPQQESDVGLAVWIEQRIAPLRGAAPDEVRAALFRYWDELETSERFLLVKLIGGGFRVGVSRLLVTRALSAIAAVDSKLVAQRLMGWTDGRVQPTAQGFLQLIAAPSADRACGTGRPTLSLFPGACAASRSSCAGRPGGLAGRVEIRRHARATGVARRAEFPVVARRGPDYRTFPRTDVDPAAAGNGD